MSLREAWPQGALSPLGHVRHTGGLQAAAPKPSSAVRGLLDQFVLSDSRAPAAASLSSWPKTATCCSPSRVLSESIATSGQGDFEVGTVSSYPTSPAAHILISPKARAGLRLGFSNLEPPDSNRHHPLLTLPHKHMHARTHTHTHTHTSSGSPSWRMSHFDNKTKNSMFFSSEQTLIGSVEKNLEGEESK